MIRATYMPSGLAAAVFGEKSRSTRRPAGTSATPATNASEACAAPFESVSGRPVSTGRSPAIATIAIVAPTTAAVGRARPATRSPPRPRSSRPRSDRDPGVRPPPEHLVRPSRANWSMLTVSYVPSVHAVAREFPEPEAHPVHRARVARRAADHDQVVGQPARVVHSLVEPRRRLADGEGRDAGRLRRGGIRSDLP